MAKEKNELQAVIADISVDKVGVIRLEDWPDSPLSIVAAELLPEAKTIVVMAMEVFREMVKFLTSGRSVGELALRDLCARNADIANGHLDWESYKLMKSLHELGYQGIPLPAGDAPFDDRFLVGGVSYKDTAVKAGLGIVGWNTMLLTPEYGARVRLACVVTDAPIEKTSANIEYYPCVDCGGACVKVCPVKALQSPEAGESSHIDRFLCNTYLSSSGGCSECLRVCLADKLFAKKS